MTIRRSIDVAHLNTQLGYMQTTAREAPSGCFDDIKAINGDLGDAVDEFIRTCLSHHLEAPTCDQIREVEAVMYGYMRDANPGVFETAEGFGKAFEEAGRHDRSRLVRQLERDRDELAKIAALAENSQQ